MRKNSFLMPAFIVALLFLFTSLQANHLDGLWRNSRQNITIRIEQDNDGFRAKRIDQGIWHNYRQEDDDVFVDRNGNWYEVVDEDELEWNEANTNKRLIFQRVGNRETVRDNDDRWNNDNSNNIRTALEGRWYNTSTKERLEIEEIAGGYRVRTQHSAWERYIADRRGNRLRSESGNTIQMLDRNTIRWTSYQGRHEKTYVRQGSTRADDQYDDRDDDRYNDRHNDRHNDRIKNKKNNGKKYGHRAKEEGRGRSKCCG